MFSRSSSFISYLNFPDGGPSKVAAVTLDAIEKFAQFSKRDLYIDFVCFFRVVDFFFAAKCRVNLSLCSRPSSFPH